MRLYKRIYAVAYWLGSSLKSLYPRMNAVFILSMAEFFYFISASLALDLKSAQAIVYILAIFCIGFNTLYFRTGRNHEEAIEMLSSISYREKLFFIFLCVMSVILVFWQIPHRQPY